MDRITLGNDEFEGLNDAYVLERDSGDELALVDTGVSTPEVREQLEKGLAARGYEFSDVDAIVLTHYHVDHAGLAGEIQSAGDATVYVHEADAPLVAQAEGVEDELEARREERFDQWAVPADAREELLAFAEAAIHLKGEPADVTPIEDGEVLEVAGHRLETIHTPGHTAGHCSYELDGGAEAFVGDALLPVYTPNIGGADVRVDRPLQTYRETLERLLERDYDRVWPGHRDPIEEPAERAREILEHHEERSARVREILAEYGPCDAWTVSAHLFGDLSGVHILHGPGEAFAHLDHLAHEGVCSFDAATGEYALE
ncbi:MBL fold metallo-hydrolase [Natrarchaeobaculum aegyptiacum]|uniref:MBL fold metallo-hydrolase n=1 Tax=Natrarchaeobaculum aegyptiacum TaxID=745377 RepID=A0A2Z2HQ86_9EURY|nr:MBL fold metallo-hydrolase [Natrarchaeobaculum aegyptiacum]ARS89179.1 MBL fold metallo-hydrolase [Natrarchaeobaculum aegyptiacum]